MTEEEVRGLAGLGEAEAAERLRRDGPNELPSARPRTLLDIGLEVVRQPMIALLVACGAVYLVLGDVREAAVLLASVFVVIGISLYQTQKTDRALDALRDLSSPRALVLRDGRERRIPGREVVRGDLLVLSEGDRVPADGTVLWANNLRVDESLLTGESVPVDKAAAAAEGPPARPVGNDTVSLYSGTLAVAGQGVMRVDATGAATALGRIGRSLEKEEEGATSLERQVAVFVRVLGTVGVALCVAVALVYGLAREQWLGGILAGLALAMALMPEEFPVILTLLLTLGAWRIARRHVLVRRLAALEALGATTVLCVDKTGTLTENRMAVRALAADGTRVTSLDGPGALPPPLGRLLEFAVLASERNPFDPMERAIRDAGSARLPDPERWTLVREYPLSPALLAMSHVWTAPEGDGWVVAAKGAPEAIVDLCHLDEARTAAVTREVAALAEDGLRVLGVAGVVVQSGALPKGQHDFPFELLGLVGLADPVRPAVPAAVAACYRAGIRIVMITGDYPATARHIAAEIGLVPRDEVISGAELDAMDAAELARRIPTVNVFARVVPEQKLRLVHALRAHGHVVAMTGDGVNDAPALKAADIGIAMGGRGTDVAREAADLVLVDDDFSSIVQAVRLGRRVYDNIRKAMAYVLAIHVPIAGVSLLPVLLGWPLVLLPVHIVFLELIIDPACSIAFEAEPEEADVMDRPPRPPAEPVFRVGTIVEKLFEGVLALLVVCGALLFAVQAGYGDDRTRTIAFSTLVLVNLALILANRSESRSALRTLGVPNPVLGWIAAGAVLVLALGVTMPPLRSVLRLAALSPADVAVIVGAAAFGLLGLDLLAAIARRGDARPGATLAGPAEGTRAR